MPPTVKIEKKELVVLNEEPCVIEAVITGNPTPDVKWFKDEKIIDYDDKTKYELVDNLCKLTFPCTLPEFSGMYKCAVENVVGKSEATTKIVVHGK